MAKATLNPVFELFTGKIGNLIFRRAHTGKLSVMYHRDTSHIKWSSAQKAHRERFRKAVAYAKTAMNDPAIRSVYEQMAAEKTSNKRPSIWPSQIISLATICSGNSVLTIKTMQRSPGGGSTFVTGSFVGQPCCLNQELREFEFSEFYE